MVGIKTFFESSTIHGLSYISLTNGITRVLWMLIVVFGFTSAFWLIHQSFQAWAESPITTTIETLPINKITLPKVTVCPPKNTFTDLNYDLMMIENVTLSEDNVTMLIEYAMEVLQDDFFQGIMVNLSKFQENNRFYNWYHGITKISLPTWHMPDKQRPYLAAEIETSALTGSIFTKTFGEQFRRDNLDLFYRLKLNISLLIHEENAVLSYFLQKMSMTDLPDDSYDIMILKYESFEYYPNETYHQNFSLSGSFPILVTEMWLSLLE